MARFVVFSLRFLVLIGIAFAVRPAQAAPLDLKVALSERSLGNADAPLTIEEFLSLDCPHCADFHDTVFPQIKKDYIDTGKVRLVVNDFPLDDLALHAHMLARCVPPSHYFGMVGALFETQSQWRMSAPAEADADMIKIAQLSGLTETEAKDCLANDALKTAIMAARTLAHEQHNVNGTPTFLIGETRVPGALPYEDFKDLIDEALARKAGGK